MSDAGFNISGVKELENAINQNFIGSKAKRIRKEALNAGGALIVKQLKENLEPFKDKGYTIDEIVKTNPRSSNDIEQLQIGWNGPHERWRIIHLNEFGYTKMGKQYTPKGFGAINKTIKESENEYFAAVAERMKTQL